MIIEPWQWALGWLGALLIGLTKGGVPGVGHMTVAIYALTFPAKDSVGILLPVLICGDIMAVTIYRKHAEWQYFLKMIPWAAAGVIIGYFTLDKIDNEGVKVFIGSVLLGITFLHFFRRWMLKRAGQDGPDPLPHNFWVVAATGTLGGFVTMMANAAGPVWSIYLLAVGLPKMAFIGTTAWFFLIVNLFKVPFQVDLGMINFSSISLSLALAPAAALGAMIAPFVVRHINQKVFETLVWIFVVAAGLQLLLR